ncbi:MAG: PHP domain-containing protein, partial [Polaromonas sp.]|uniref:PHP domain-containing protein n=1 Tax=Polaromonas sp. TaxID=1869339 RepID=UPI00272F8051
MFVHLRIHTEFSVVDGTNRIDEIVEAAAADRQPALAITDLSNLFGTIKFYKECRKTGVKPLIGADVWVQVPGKEAGAPAARLLLLVQNHRGYLNLSELITRAWTKNVVRDQAVIKLEWLQELNEGLIALSGAQGGAVGQALVQGDGERAQECALHLAAIFSQRFYLELQRAQRPDDERHVAAAVQLAARLGLPVVATHPVQFLTYEDYEAHEARVCISEGEILGNARRVRKFTREQYFKSSAQMAELFADLPSALANTLEIAKRCNLKLELGKAMLPEYPTPEVNGVRMPPDEYFRYASFQGLEERLAHLYPNETVRNEKRPQYVERLEFEINTILKMG